MNTELHKKVAESIAKNTDAYETGFIDKCASLGIDPKLVKQAGGLGQMAEGLGHIAAKPIGWASKFFGQGGRNLSERIGQMEAKRNGLGQMLDVAGESTGGVPTAASQKNIEAIKAMLTGAEQDPMYKTLGKYTAGAGAGGLVAGKMALGGDKPQPEKRNSIYF